MYLRFVGIKLIELVGFLLGIPIFLFLYPMRFRADRNPKHIFYWWTNNDEPNFTDRWYGVYEIYGGDYEKFHGLGWFQKWIISWRWVVFRNPSWVLKHKISKHVIGEKENVVVKSVKGDAHPMTWRNKSIKGRQNCTFYVNGRKHFRFSYTIPLAFGLWWNVMLGTGEWRYISKSRIFKP